MTRYRMQDGTIVETKNAVESWNERTEWDGQNHCSVHTSSQWNHQTLHRSRKNRYYVEHTSQWQGSNPHVEWVSPEEATRWLLLNEDELPEDLESLKSQIME